MSLSAAVTGVFSSRTEFSDAVLPQRERISLRLGLTSLLTRKLYAEPTVSFDLTGPGSSVTVGVSLPYTSSP